MSLDFEEDYRRVRARLWGERRNLVPKNRVRPPIGHTKLYAYPIGPRMRARTHIPGCTEAAKEWCDNHDISFTRIIEDVRDAETMLDRQRLYLYLHGQGFPYAVIGRTLQRDHTTVRHGCLKLQGLLKKAA